MKRSFYSGAAEVRQAELEADSEELGEGRTEPKTFALTTEEAEVLDFVIETSASVRGSEFARLVNSTYPAITQGDLPANGLVELAQEYQEIAGLLDSQAPAKS
jgi:hypothetical protein